MANHRLAAKNRMKNIHGSSDLLDPTPQSGGVSENRRSEVISDHQQSWGYEDGPWKGPGPALLMAADLIHKPPASIRFAPIKHALAVTVEPFKFSPAEPVAYELS